MSGGFDFRDMLGGGFAAVGKDDDLADGMSSTGEIAGMHAHLMTKRDGMPFLVNNLSAHLCMNANVNALCAPALFALVLARLGQMALKLEGDTGKEQRQHLIDEVAAMLEAMRRGDA